MPTVKILIADYDEKYIMALERRFIDGYGEQAEITVITDQNFFNQFFSSPHSFDIMIVNERLYRDDFVKYDISNIFILTELPANAEKTSELNVTSIYKYTSAKEIYNEVINNLTPGSVSQNDRGESKLISFYSPSGGCGKTSVAFGLCAALAKKYKKVLYIGIDSLQSFGCFMKEPSFVQEGFEKPLQSQSDYICSIAKSVIKEELFHILPPLSKSPAALGISVDDYIFLIEKIKESAEYDYIILDGDSYFSSFVSKIMSISENVVLIAESSRIGMYKFSKLMECIDCSDLSKFTFVADKCSGDISMYNIGIRFEIAVPFYTNADEMDYEEWSELPEIKKLAYKYI